MGRCYLGDYIGDTDTDATERVDNIHSWLWVEKLMAEVACQKLQASYAGIDISIQHERCLVQRVTHPWERHLICLRKPHGGTYSRNYLNGQMHPSKDRKALDFLWNKRNINYHTYLCPYLRTETTPVWTLDTWLLLSDDGQVSVTDGRADIQYQNNTNGMWMLDK